MAPLHPAGPRPVAPDRAGDLRLTDDAQELVYHPEQLTIHYGARARRAMADPSWERISWDTALDLAAVAGEIGIAEIRLSTVGADITAIHADLGTVCARGETEGLVEQEAFHLNIPTPKAEGSQDKAGLFRHTSLALGAMSILYSLNRAGRVTEMRASVALPTQGAPCARLGLKSRCSFLICLGVCMYSPREHLMKEQGHGTPGVCPGTSAHGVTVALYVHSNHPLLQLKRAAVGRPLRRVMRRHWQRAGKNTDGRPGLPWDVALYVPLVVLRLVEALNARAMEA